MKYSRNQINKAGEILITSSDREEVSHVINIIDDWRELHLLPLDNLYNTIIEILEKENIQIHFVSRRLKRLSSIQNKLDRNPKMGLGGLQDIGGLRIVVLTINILNKVLFILENNIPEHFELTKSPTNYIENPKESGYRSIHFIYKYKSENKNLDGIRIELQLRTKLQHSWAMAVETAELDSKTALKSSEGDTNWLNFFKIASSLFALKEKTPILTEHIEKGYSKKDLLRQLYKLDNSFNIVNIMKGLNDVSIFHSTQEKHKNGYYILDINFIEKTITIKTFLKEHEKEASIEYSALEKKAEENKNAVVLVSVPEIQQLQEAYPSYYLDTNNFIKTIKKEMNKEIGILNEKTFPQFVAKFHPESKNQYTQDKKEFSDLVKDNIKKMEEQ